MKKLWTIIFMGGLIASYGAFEVTQAAEKKEGGHQQLIKIVTTSPGVPWHLMGARVAAELNKRMPNISASGSTGGSTANIVDVSKGTAQIGWTVHDTAIQAYQGLEKFKTPIKGFSVITPFAQTPWQIIVHKNADVNSIYDLASKRVAVGQATWGTTDLTLRVLKILGITPETFKQKRGVLIYTGYDAWQVQMQDRTIDAVLYWGGIPSSLTISMINEPGVKFIELKEEDIKKVLSNPELQFLFPSGIPKGIYPQITADIKSFAYASIAIANDKLNENVVYEVAKIICEPTPEIKEIYKDGLSLTLDLAKKFFAINKELPIHPGAQKYFREKGFLK